MPASNTVKMYIKGAYYHIYNRGVEKRIIFLDKQDYSVFLRFLKEYLLPPNHPDLIKLQEITPRRKPVNCYEHITLLAFCLMPNHFHLFVKQKSQNGLRPFMQAVTTNYVMYFNHKYKRIGPLFQGIYKAALINEELYFLYISRYIHRNPLSLSSFKSQSLSAYPYSSYQYYLSGNTPQWLNTGEILSLFRSGKSLTARDMLSYQSFVEDDGVDQKISLDRNLTLEDD